MDHIPAERSIRLANDGIVDGDCMRIDSIEQLYPNLVQVPEAIFHVKFTAFVRKGFTLQPEWDGLKPHHVGALYGWKLIEMRVKAVEPKSFVRVDKAESLFQMLQLGRIDVAALNTLDGVRKLKEMKLSEIVPVKPPLASVPLYFCLHKSHTDLVEPLTDVFRSMKEDGTWQRIEAAHLPEID